LILFDTQASKEEFIDKITTCFQHLEKEVARGNSTYSYQTIHLHESSQCSWVVYFQGRIAYYGVTSNTFGSPSNARDHLSLELLLQIAKSGLWQQSHDVCEKQHFFFHF
jgi:hypothetical protein